MIDELKEEYELRVTQLEKFEKHRDKLEGELAQTKEAITLTRGAMQQIEILSQKLEKLNEKKEPAEEVTEEAE